MIVFVATPIGGSGAVATIARPATPPQPGRAWRQSGGDTPQSAAFPGRPSDATPAQSRRGVPGRAAWQATPSQPTPFALPKPAGGRFPSVGTKFRSSAAAIPSSAPPTSRLGPRSSSFPKVCALGYKRARSYWASRDPWLIERIFGSAAALAWDVRVGVTSDRLCVDVDNPDLVPAEIQTLLDRMPGCPTPSGGPSLLRRVVRVRDLPPSALSARPTATKSAT